MPLCAHESRPAGSGQPVYTAVVAVPTFNAAATIADTLASIVASIACYRQSGGTGRVAISIVDDASTDQTAAIVADFARRCDDDVFLTVQPLNGGRARARNLAVAAVDADCCLFLDHDDVYEPGHIQICLETLARRPAVDFVKTGVRLSDPVHPDWAPRIAASLTQNVCVRAHVHRLIGGFQEDPEVERYGCDDQLYNRTLRECFRGVDMPTPTVTFVRRPGNSFDRQYERKFNRPQATAEITLSPEQLRLQPRILELHDQRLAEVHARLARLGRVVHRTGSIAPVDDRADRSLDRIEPRPFSNEGDRIYAMLVTGKSPERATLARASVASFLLQDYSNRALVVVNDGPFELDVSAVPADRVTVVRPRDRHPLGTLRNLGLDVIPDSALWTYWDDDDWHHPAVMGAQRAMLSRMGVPACLLACQVKYSLTRDTAFVDYHPGGFAGTLMAVKDPSLRFPPVASGEDTAYTAALKALVPSTAWPNPPHYFLRLFHGHNTWDARHFGLDERPDGWELPPGSARYLRSVLPLLR